MKKIRRYSILFLVFVFVLSFSSLAYAIEFTTTYSELAPTSTQSKNLISLACNYDSFANSEYVIFRDSQYSYYIVWGDLSEYTGVVSGSDVEYIHYFSSSSGGPSSSYQYSYGTDDNFTLISNYECTSNIEGYGFKSLDYEQFYFYKNINLFAIFISSMFFVVMLQQLRGGYK